MRFLELIESYPDLITDASTHVNNAILPKYEFNKIIVCGMGGSAISGDLLKELLRDSLAIHIDVSREYHLPAYADEETLVFCLSYSGNTEETLSQFVDAINVGCKMISITSNGKLLEWSNKLNLPVVKIPQGYQPRASLPLLLIPMIVYLQIQGLVDFKNDIEESVDVIKSISDNKYLDVIAHSLLNENLVVYATHPFTSVARRVKTQLNENTKIPARFDIFPELNHNEIVGYQNNTLNNNLSIILLRDKNEPIEVKARIEITKQLLNNKAKIFEIWSLGRSKLAKMLTLVYQTDYLTVKLAELYGVEIKSTPSIEYMKNELRKQLHLVEKLERAFLNTSLTK